MEEKPDTATDSAFVYVNDIPTSFTEGSTLIELVEQLAVPHVGIAIAINLEIVSKSHWGDTVLRSSDRIEIVSIASGG